VASLLATTSFLYFACCKPISLLATTSSHMSHPHFTLSLTTAMHLAAPTLLVPPLTRHSSGLHAEGTIFQCPSRTLLPWPPPAGQPSVFGRNLQSRPVRGADTREECHWSHACSLHANVRGIQWHSRVYISDGKRAPCIKQPFACQAGLRPSVSNFSAVAQSAQVPLVFGRQSQRHVMVRK
jgi:hypothetical protein